RGYLKLTPQNVFMATAKGFDFLKAHAEAEYPEKYNTALIRLAEGQGKGDTLHKTDAFLKLIQDPDFYALFYPEFYKSPGDQQAFLIPDGALILRRGGKAKLIFLEVENPKPNWKSHLEGKRAKYEAIGREVTTWDKWWRHWSEVLNLRFCPREQFSFSVWCIGDFEADWVGWKFRKEENF
uniref:hypothetical protein n=1 Tax=Desulfatibacillum aliphaticivorans TaxID=218208 RepID=UPI001B7FEBBB